MGITKQLFIFIALILPSLQTSAQDFKGYVQLKNGHSIFVDHLAANPGESTLVLLNGLTYNTKSWDPMMPYISNRGFGVLRFNFQGQDLNDGFLKNPISVQDQAQDLKLLLEELNINTPVSLAGLSYGGGVEIVFSILYPDMVDKLIPMALYMGIEKDHDSFIRFMVASARMMFLFTPYTNEQLYDHFLRHVVYTFFPLAEPSLLTNTNKKENTFRLLQGIRKTQVLDLVPSMPNKPVHLIVAERDGVIPSSAHDAFWKSLNSKQQASRLTLLGAGHKIPESAPALAGKWISAIMNYHKHIAKGRVFEGSTSTEKARCGNLIIQLR